MRVQQSAAVPLVPETTPRGLHCSDGADTARDSVLSGQTGTTALDAEVDAALEALCSDAETVKQVAVLTRGQVRSLLQAGGRNVPVWVGRCPWACSS